MCRDIFISSSLITNITDCFVYGKQQYNLIFYVIGRKLLGRKMSLKYVSNDRHRRLFYKESQKGA